MWFLLVYNRSRETLVDRDWEENPNVDHEDDEIQPQQGDEYDGK